MNKNDNISDQLKSNLFDIFERSSKETECFINNLYEIKASDAEAISKHSKIKYYSFALILVESAKQADNVAADISQRIEAFDVANEIDLKKNYSKIFDVYMNFRNITNEFMNSSEQIVNATPSVNLKNQLISAATQFIKRLKLLSVE